MPGVPFSNVEGEWRIPLLRRLFTDLGGQVRFIQYDGRGTGRSQRDVSDFSLEAYIGDLDAVVEASGASQVVLLGFFHSVTHAIAWAARHPERVRGLVLFGGALRGWDPMQGAGTQALLSLIERDWDTFVESAAHAWLGWPEGDEGRLAADWFRTATTPAIARATLQAAYAIDVTADAARRPLPGARPASGRCDGDPVRPVRRARPGAPERSARDAPRRVGQPVLRGWRPGRRAADPSSSRIPRRRIRSPPPRSGAARTRGSGTLSPREIEVLRLLANGETNGQIAASLEISINTVERHVSNLYRKIDAGGRADATAWAIRNGVA